MNFTSKQLGVLAGRGLTKAAGESGIPTGAEHRTALTTPAPHRSNESYLSLINGEYAGSPPLSQTYNTLRGAQPASASFLGSLPDSGVMSEFRPTGPATQGALQPGSTQLRHGLPMSGEPATSRASELLGALTAHKRRGADLESTIPSLEASQAVDADNPALSEWDPGSAGLLKSLQKEPPVPVQGGSGGATNAIQQIWRLLAQGGGAPPGGVT